MAYLLTKLPLPRANGSCLTPNKLIPADTMNTDRLLLFQLLQKYLLHKRRIFLKRACKIPFTCVYFISKFYVIHRFLEIIYLKMKLKSQMEQAFKFERTKTEPLEPLEEQNQFKYNCTFSCYLTENTATLQYKQVFYYCIRYGHYFQSRLFERRQ